MAKLEKWLAPEGLLLIRGWAMDGLNISQIAHNIGISCKTLWQWRNNYPELDEAISFGKDIADYTVQNSLFQLATGHEKRTTKTIIDNKPDKDGNVYTRVETTVEEVLPNVTAVLAYLNNRRPDKWKRNRDDDALSSDMNDKSITINVIRKSPSEDDTKSSNKKAEQKEEVDWES